jgi:serine/threonine protein kinase
MSESEVLSIFSDICEGVAHLHSMNPPIAHRDIKVPTIAIVTARERERERERERNKQEGRQAGKQTGRQTDSICGKILMCWSGPCRWRMF